MPPNSPIAAALEEIAGRTVPSASDAPLPEPPPDQPGPKRRWLKRERTTLEPSDEGYLELDQVEELLMSSALDYITGPHPHVLLLAVDPGGGKTRAGVKLAEDLAAAGKRVLYLGPQHRFFADLQTLARRPGWWYEWLGHQEGDEATGRPETCRHAGAMERWVQRGYQGIDFCKNAKICGWDYIRDHCAWHAQARSKPRIVFAQHAHLFGLPDLDDFDLIIGDENPMAAVMGSQGPGGNWTIPARFIAPPNMDLQEPFTEIVHRLAMLATSQTRAEGPDLLSLLGGHEAVWEACSSYHEPISQRLMSTPDLRNAEGVEAVPYGHLLVLGHLLWKEADARLMEKAYPHRVYIANEKLHLLMRRYAHKDTLTKPLIWLDATASQRIYEAIFTPRPVQIVTARVRHQGRIFQVWQRANGKSSLLNRPSEDEDVEPTERAEQTKMLIQHIITRHGYTNPAYVTFKGLQEYFGERTVNFSDVGTNTIQDCDALFAVGTPQPERHRAPGAHALLGADGGLQDRLDARGPYLSRTFRLGRESACFGVLDRQETSGGALAAARGQDHPGRPPGAPAAAQGRHLAPDQHPARRRNEQSHPGA
jgi:hypothetical protein